MPRTARILLPGCIYHLTHRCHNGSFFLRFDTARMEYRQRLWRASRRFKIRILNYSITSNHTHLLLIVLRPASVSTFMRHLEGEFAAQYNRRKSRRGAFWSERYHATLIESGTYFWNCMHYIDLNMVRAGVVNHPANWLWCGYQEIAGFRQRYRILDLEELARLGGANDPSTFAAWYQIELDQTVLTSSGCRQPHWSESLAVGSKAFVESVAGRSKNRKKLVIREWADNAWCVCEPKACYETTDTGTAEAPGFNSWNTKKPPIFWL